MTMTAPPRHAAPRHAATRPKPDLGFTPGPLGRLGGWVTTHARITTVVWLLVIVGLGAFAPRVEAELSGAGWQANGSDSVAARELAQEHFGGNASTAIQVVVHSDDGPVTKGAGADVLAEATKILAADSRIAEIVQPQPGASLSQDGSTAVLLAGAGADPNEMVRVADDLKGPLQDLSTGDVEVNPTGASLLWSDFNEANLDAMLKSEMFSWPVTLAILVLAFGALVAAGLPLLLTLAGLVASAGSLVLINQFVPVSIWAMNFAMMFALALGIDYALFLVVRYRAARMGSGGSREQAVAETMDTAGKAVLLSGATVLISLSAVMLVPSPSFRSMAGGIMLAVIFVLAATLTLLPLVLFKLDHRINKLALPWVNSGEHRSPRFAMWGERLWKQPVLFGLASLIVLRRPGRSPAGPEDGDALDQGAARRRQCARGLRPGAVGVRRGRPRHPDDRDAEGRRRRGDRCAVRRTRASPRRCRRSSPSDGSDLAMIQAVPTVDPSDPALGTTVDRLRGDLPEAANIGGAAVENLDLKTQLDESTPLVIGGDPGAGLPAAARSLSRRR